MNQQTDNRYGGWNFDDGKRDFEAKFQSCTCNDFTAVVQNRIFHYFKLDFVLKYTENRDLNMLVL